MVDEHVDRSVRSYMTHLEHGDTWHLRQNVLHHLVLTRGATGDGWPVDGGSDGGMGYNK